MPLISALTWKQRQKDLCKFEASLLQDSQGYRERSRRRRRKRKGRRGEEKEEEKERRERREVLKTQHL